MYVNPVHKEIFESAGFEEEYYERKLKYIELSILASPQPLSNGEGTNL